MKTKRIPKTFAEDMAQSLNRRKQLQAMKKQLLRKARERQKEMEKSGVNQ